MTENGSAVLRLVEAEQERAIRFLQEFTRVNTYNPPGDTRAGAAFIRRFLDENGLSYKIVAPQTAMPNIVAHTSMGTPGRHLVLNGHIDVFPPGDPTHWSRDPLSGDIVDGAVFGRGTVDMKCGTTASIFAYLVLNRLRDHLRGRLTLTVVSDEETGGRWGTGYLIEHHSEEVLGDCVLNGEPSSPWTVRFGEKAPIWFKFHIHTPGAHGAYPHLSKSATKIAAHLMLDLEKLEQMQPVTPEAVARTINRADVRAAIERGLGNGATEVMNRLTVNFGVVQGGVKVNMLPGDCVIEADIRMPIGIRADDVRSAIGRILQHYPEVRMEEGQHYVFDPTWSDPDHEMLRLIQQHAEALAGERPAAIITLGGTDCRFWRAKRVPAYVYGCSPDRMGASDESVPISQFLHVLKTHALAAHSYLSRS
jgi:succinyl-diaminopimelate desuccinylase